MNYSKSRLWWTFAITSTAVFMTALDNLVVTTALPAIRTELDASIQSLEWVVNAYTLTFAVLLLLGAAMGDRFGRRLMFVLGLLVFTGASAAAALAPTSGALIAARAVQGGGGAVVLPLSLTLLTAAAPPQKRGLLLGAWGAVNGLAVAAGPLIGGLIVEHGSWQWIFWLNVPVGLLLVPLGWARLSESRGPHSRLDVTGTALASLGFLGIVYGLIRGQEDGWTAWQTLGSLVGGVTALAVFVWWESRAPHPILPMRLFRNRSFTTVNLAGMLMFAGMFGSIFLLTQYLQGILGYTPQQAGVRMLPWTAMPIIVAPLAGVLADRIGAKTLVSAGLALQLPGLGWLALHADVDVSYAVQVPGFVLCGVGMALFITPITHLLMNSVTADEHGVASGAHNALREVGGVLGVTILASVFSAYGDYGSPQHFVDGLVPALGVGVGILALGLAVTLLIPAVRRGNADHADSATSAIEAQPMTSAP